MDNLKKNPLSTQIDLSKFSQEMFAPATEDEKRQQDVMSESTTFFKDGMRKLFKNPLAVGSLIVLVCIILTIIIAPMIVPYRYEEILSVNGKRDKGAKNLAPFTYSKMEQQYIEQGGERFPTSSAPTNSAATTSSASSTARASPWPSASSPASSCSLSACSTAASRATWVARWTSL